MWLGLALLVGLIVLSALSPFGCACAGGLESRGLETIEAIEALDAERTAGCFIEEIREEIIPPLEMVFAVVDEIRIFNVGWQVLSEVGEAATVEVEVDWEATAAAAIDCEALGVPCTRGGHAKEPVPLVKVDGEWLISDFAPFAWLVVEVMRFAG
jgi:hypothetical protein